MSDVYLYGHPVGHSLSPAMHNAAFARLGLGHRYAAVDVPLDGVQAAVARLREASVLGANVTVPHKLAVMPFVDRIATDAEAIGAINTIVRSGDALVGHNTDGYGFAAAWKEAGIDVHNGFVLVLGAGGAARAILPAILAEGNHVELGTRSPERADSLARSHERVSVVTWPTAETPWRWDLVVNATPLGLRGEDPLPGVRIPQGTRVFDLIPTAKQTAFLQRVRADGVSKAVDGLLMLLHQAARSFELWTGENAPVDVMRAALPRTDLVN